MTPEQAELKALGFEVPDSITPIIACRSWRMRGKLLCSHNGTPWTPGEAMKAECMIGPDHHVRLLTYYGSSKGLNLEDTPLKVCTCGIYAAKHEDANTIVPTTPMYVHGEIYMWGKIIEGPFGYRAEFAYPKRFFATSQTQKATIEALRFGVPVVLVERGPAFPFRFPFPQGKAGTAMTKTKSRADRFYITPLLPGVPGVALGVLDCLILDMSQVFSQVIVAVQFSIGIAAVALGISFRRKIRRIYR